MPSTKYLVLDSSVVKWLNREGEADLGQSDQVFLDGQHGKINIALPELVKYEVGNALLYKGLELPALKVSLSTIYSLPATYFTLDLNLAEWRLK